MLFPPKNIPRICIICGYRGYEKSSPRLFFRKEKAVKCPKCRKRGFIRDYTAVF